MPGRKTRVSVLISGRGSNMVALLDAASDQDYPAEIVSVISDNTDAQGLAFAAARGIGTRAILRGDYPSKEAHETAIDAALMSTGTELVALAGYMRLLTAPFVEKWAGRMINIHPSLLPLFKGLNTHRRALEAGMRIHGCTVHFVTPTTDDGPIIAQAAVPVLLSDTEESLSARVLKAEHHTYQLALRLVAEGKARMEEGRTVFAGVDDRAQGMINAPAVSTSTPDVERLARWTP